MSNNLTDIGVNFLLDFLDNLSPEFQEELFKKAGEAVAKPIMESENKVDDKLAAVGMRKAARILEVAAAHLEGGHLTQVADPSTVPQPATPPVAP